VGPRPPPPSRENPMPPAPVPAPAKNFRHRPLKYPLAAPSPVHRRFAGSYRPRVWHSPLATARIRAPLHLFHQINQSLARVAMNLEPVYDRGVVKPIEA